MFRTTVILAAVLALLLPATAEELRPYKHPGLDMQFSAAPGWRHQPRPGDEGTHERVDPESGIHALMWSTSTEQSAERYLKKMASMIDIAPGGTFAAREINGRDASVLTTEGTILAVIPSGKSRRYPFENKLYIVKIECPADCLGEMEQLLETVRLNDRLLIGDCSHRLYPETSESPPDLPSPFITDGGDVYVTVRTKEGRYALVPVTVENGAPNDYANGEWDKGRQLAVDATDFPTLARTGLHSEEELARATSITGRPVADITEEGRPGRASGAGFMAEDEDIIGLLRGDNELVSRLGLTHPDLAKPLFEVFNLILRDLELGRRGLVPRYNIATLLYDGHEIEIDASAAKGWQESIFSDEVQGYWSITISRELTWREKNFLRGRYPDKFEKLVPLLSSIHFGEMAPFYITRYGFYEGHTDYRADPVAIALMFGLLSIEEIDAVVDHDLYGALTRHY